MNACLHETSNFSSVLQIWQPSVMPEVEAKGKNKSAEKGVNDVEHACSINSTKKWLK